MLDDTTRSLSDPLGYYAALGVGPLADSSEIKAAYRYKAKLLHPDRNPSPEAQMDFLEVGKAYRVLTDARERQRYDASARLPVPIGLINPEDPAPQPLTCSRCGHITAQPRYVRFHRVQSFLWSSRRYVVHGIFCRDCSDRTAILASTATWMLGWWGFAGPFWTLKALVRNLTGGDKPEADNLWVLLHQARAFLARGDNDIARALAEQAMDFAGDDGERSRILGIIRSASRAPGPGRRLKDRWRPFGYAAVIQALPLLGLALAIVITAAALLFRSHTDSATAAIRVRPVQAGEVRHVAVEVLKVRQGPAATEPVVALLDRFATVQVTDTVSGGEWARILTVSGVAGYVPSRFLFGGPGDAQKSRWCTDQKGDPPANGEILLRRSGGENRLSVHNASGAGAVVRLKTPGGRTVLAFFVGAQADTVINAIPDGTYRAVFASGATYSRACGFFLDNMQAFIVPAAQQFQAVAQKGRSPELSLTLPPVGESPGQSHALPTESFLDN